MSRIQGDAVLLLGDAVRTERHDRPRPALLDVRTKGRKDLLERHRHFVDCEELANCRHRVMKEDWPRDAVGQGQEIAAEIDLNEFGACVLEFLQRFAKDTVDCSSTSTRCWRGA